MEKTVERRQMILEVLCERRFERIDNLAFEFKVNRRTIRRDIEILSITFPFYTTKGTGGWNLRCGWIQTRLDFSFIKNVKLKNFFKPEIRFQVCL